MPVKRVKHIFPLLLDANLTKQYFLAYKDKNGLQLQAADLRAERFLKCFVENFRLLREPCMKTNSNQAWATRRGSPSNAGHRNYFGPETMLQPAREGAWNVSWPIGVLMLALN